MFPPDWVMPHFNREVTNLPWHLDSFLMMLFAEIRKKYTFPIGVSPSSCGIAKTSADAELHQNRLDSHTASEERWKRYDEDLAAARLADKIRRDHEEALRVQRLRNQPQKFMLFLRSTSNVACHYVFYLT